MPSDATPSYRFYVEIGDVKEAVFTEVSGLQVEMDVTEYREGGLNNFAHFLPGPIKANRVTLKRGMTRSNDFLKWHIPNGSAPVVRKSISVVLYDVEGKRVATWNFHNAYPVKWTGPQLTADGTSVAIESLEIAHEGMQLDLG